MPESLVIVTVNGSGTLRFAALGSERVGPAGSSEHAPRTASMSASGKRPPREMLLGTNRYLWLMCEVACVSVGARLHHIEPHRSSRDDFANLLSYFAGFSAVM
jgi:hypothetical protein